MSIFKVSENPRFKFTDIPRNKRVPIILCHEEHGIEYTYSAEITKLNDVKKTFNAIVTDIEHSPCYPGDPCNIVSFRFGLLKAEQIIEMDLR